MIEVEHICKTYKVAKRKAGLREACKSLFSREYEEIRALDDVSFTIRDGEMVGYMGPNGAKINYKHKSRQYERDGYH